VVSDTCTDAQEWLQQVPNGFCRLLPSVLTPLKEVR